MKGKILEFKDLSSSREMIEHKIPKFMLWFFYFILITLMFLLIWSYLGKKEIVVQASGAVSTENVQIAVPLTSNIISEVNFKEGDHVKKGDLVVSLDTNSYKYDINNYVKALEGYNNDLTLQELYLESINKEVNQFSLTSFDEVTKYYEVEEFLSLLEAKDDPTKFKNEKLSEITLSIKQTNSTITQYENEISKLNGELKKLEYYANFDGVIHFTTNISSGSSVQAGYELFRIYEEAIDKSLDVELLIPNKDIALVHVNQVVRVEIPALSTREYGYASARVISIESDSRYDQNSGQSYYVVKARLEENFLKNNNEKEDIIIGMQIAGRLVVDEQRYLFWGIEKLELWIFD